MTAPIQNPGSNPYVILAALSFDEPGNYALVEAARVASLHDNAQLHVVHVVREEGEVESSGELVSLERRLAHAPAEIERRIERLIAEMPHQVTAHLRAGVPARSILQTAVDIAADLVVVGTHQRRGMQKLVLGSVAEQVLRQANCPVLIAMPKNYHGLTASESIEPPCPRCVQVRRESQNQTFWCEQHARTYKKPHVYEPSGSTRRQSVMPTY